MPDWNLRCYHCRRPGSTDEPLDHWCEEWDAPIHGGCVMEFLGTAEGEVVLSHYHEVRVVTRRWRLTIKVEPGCVR